LLFDEPDAARFVPFVQTAVGVKIVISQELGRGDMNMKRQTKVGGEASEPETKKVVALPVTADLDGTEIKVYVHMITGQEPRPALALLSTLHGSEFFSIEIMRRLLQDLDPSRLKGTVLVVPVGNPVALQMLTRNTPDESDGPDLNRVFPGKFTWIAEQLAKVIIESVLRDADYLIDFHSGSWGHVTGTVSYGIDFDEEVSERSRELAFAFGYPCVKAGKVATGFPGPRSSTGYAGAVLKIPNLGVDIGGLGFDKAYEEFLLKMNVDGIRNVMIHVGMLEGELALPDNYLVWQKRWRVNPSVGGYLLPEIPPSDLMREVREGQILGNIVSPYTFEVLETLTAPGDGILFMTARDYPVRPGDWAYGVVDLHDDNTKWIVNPL
jgi:predicted deacylase